MELTKRILFVYAKGNLELSDRKSAIGSYIFVLAELLSSEDVEICLNGVPLSEYYQDSGPEAGRTERHRWIRWATDWLKRRTPDAWLLLLKDVAAFYGIRRLRKRIVRSGTHYDDVIEFYTFGSNIGSAVSAALNCNFVLVYDSPVIEERRFFSASDSVLIGAAESRQSATIARASKIVVNGEPLKKYVMSLFDVSESKFYVHQNVDFSRLRKCRQKDYLGPIKICFVGSFLKWHRVDLLIEAFGALREVGVEAALYLAGAGMELPAAMQLVNSSRYRQDISFVGFLDGENLFQFQRKMHVGVMPSSNWYGAPNKIFEYGATGMACLAPDTPTIRYLFSDDEVMFFENGNLESLAGSLIALCADTRLMSRLADNLYRRIVSTYSPDGTRRAYRELLALESA